MSHIQSHSVYPVARSGSDNDIIQAATARAKFWQYPDAGPWIVTVTVGKRNIEVEKQPGEAPLILRR